MYVQSALFGRPFAGDVQIPGPRCPNGPKDIMGIPKIPQVVLRDWDK